MELVAQYRDNPLGFVECMFPWLEPDTPLEKEEGPDVWQADILTTIGEECKKRNENLLTTALRIAVSSGHGVGKTCLVAWIILWFISTRGKLQIVVTSNTQVQLQTKTWRELAKWHRLIVNEHWFKWSATQLKSIENPATHFATAVPWSKSNVDAFAGTHEENVLIIFDEASMIIDQIWEVTEGALTQKGAIWIAFGNPTRNEGRFRECFKKFRHRWITRQVDSRTAKKANKDQIEEWMTDYGDDSDFARVRVKGQFPRVSDMQFIPLNLVEEARARKLEFKDYRDSPIIISADIARFGNDKTVITIRQGNKLIEQREFREIDLMTALALIATAEDEYDAQGVFVDETGGLGAGIIDRARQLLRKWFGYIGGSKSSSAKYFNKRAEVYGMTREWLKHADLSSLDQKTYQYLEDDLTAVQYGFSANGDKLQLERKEDLKKRDLASPDFSDSLTIGFTQVVRPKFDPNKDRYGAQERLRKARKRAMRHQGRNVDTGY